MLPARTTTYAPDIFNSLKGIILVHKPSGVLHKTLLNTLKEKISDELNEYDPRPLSSRLLIEGGHNEDKSLVQAPNLADHPLVSGPRYNPWDIKIFSPPPYLSLRSSGVTPIILGRSIGYYLRKFMRVSIVSSYHITGRFGHTTDNMFSDGNITDKHRYEHIRLPKIDRILSRIEGRQRDRLFEASSIPLDSQEGYELAKSWPSRPLKMARWPLIYRIRCIHLALPEFRIEVVVSNENENFLAHIIHDIGLALRSSAYTESIRRVKFGMFDICDSLTSCDWNIQSMLDNLKLHSDHKRVHSYLDSLRTQVQVPDNYPHEEERSTEIARSG